MLGTAQPVVQPCATTALVASDAAGVLPSAFVAVTTTRTRLPTSAATSVCVRSVAPAIAAKIQTLPEVVRRSLTWDQGPEMRDWKQVAIAADIEIFFCDPHKPWQRGSNENTNGLLRQYFPKGTDLSLHSEAELDQVAAELNDRPRKRLGYRKPIEEIGHLFAA